MWKFLIRQFAEFSRKERIGITALTILALLYTLSPRLALRFYPGDKVDTAAFRRAVMAFEASFREEITTDRTAKAAIALPSECFYFDPNRMTVEKWQQLGLPARAAAGVIKYVEKGGKFRSPEDIRKIYAVPPALLERLIPFVRIPDKSKLTHTNIRRSEKQLRQLDINTADTLQWQGLPGIGPGYARRICGFREKLGGFYCVEQVAETYGLPDTVFNKIKAFLKIGDSSLKIIDLNLTDEKTLASHPYIRYKLAHMIVAYRSAHAGFKEVSELHSLPLVDEIIYRKIEHYIKL
ncbi:MAG: helix-hairpin-helix domain-containing protein [Chitinophaga sp.]|uniref:ComEA family DNA-binding protein n=1 Tax=Chitinophaga sp. TaxID=1869181 RepID=UPI0025C49456|nr:helix-hairpin-helix domain-containing protein [Chitinophaga sp.]MBV8254181.1 helix-hairpin-helix domain-containing protein [Chitinophaga sp.]